eukprot:scaffold4420_cov187-Amphora_coffeaeformis.AAC.33
MIASHGPIGMVQDRSELLTIGIPNRHATTIFMDGPFNLVRRRGNAPGEIGRKGIVGWLTGRKEPLIDGVIGGRIIARQVHAVYGCYWVQSARVPIVRMVAWVVDWPATVAEVPRELDLTSDPSKFDE